MTIREENVGSIIVGALLDQPLRVPAYQRPYSWRVETALQLFDDVVAIARTGAGGREEGESPTPYVLGAVILHEHEGSLDIVDGQQRLMTLSMLVQLLEGTARLKDGADQDSAIVRVFSALSARVKAMEFEGRTAVLKAVRERCVLVRIVTDDIDEAFRIFDSQNYRGKPLAPHDLLKAHHLREMSQDPVATQRAVVDRWESAQDDELDRLFSTYLYRILKWSRGERAGSFSTHDIDAFKGISLRADLPPAARYHVAAQTAVPLMRTPGPLRNREDERLLGHARFQIDTPLVAGTPFFEMVDFFLAELIAVREEAYAEQWEKYASAERGTMRERGDRGRYRKVSELYLGALLYFTNRFGLPDPAERCALFMWAYTLRLTHQRVQEASVDKLASGDGGTGLFMRIRNAPSRAAALRFAQTEPAPDAEHDLDLAALLKELREG